MQGPDDYKPPIMNGTDLPKSCCLNLPQDGVCTKNSAEVSKEGCKSALFALLSSKSTLLAGVAVAVALIQVSCLSHSIFKMANQNWD